MADNNTDKSQHGNDGKKNLGEIIESLHKKDYIISIKPDYRNGYEGFGNQQFYYPFLVEFKNKDCWLLHSTTTVRSDRLNIPQWNAEHLKRLNSQIKKAYVVYPDSINDKELKIARGEQRKIAEHKTYSAIEGVVSQNELYSLIEQHAISLEENRGSALAKRGINFETTITDIVNNSGNLQKWKDNDKLKAGYLYETFLKIVDNIGLIKDKVIAISATNSIPLLPSGGKAKTDILIKVEFPDGSAEYTFSCKKTGADWVSVHEYSADQFIEVLGIEDPDLVKAIKEFQTVGGKGKLSTVSKEILCERMPAYNEKLNRWVLGGIGGQGDPATQWAQGIITYSEASAKITVVTLNEYVQKMTRSGYCGDFGTCFRWTYPSKGLGKKIQLKMKAI